MIKFVKLLLLVLISSLNVFGQSNATEEFKVLCQKGTNTVNGKALLSNSKLYKVDKINISKGGFVGLLHKSGKTIELKTPGLILISTLSDKFSQVNSSTTSKYTDFVINELTKKESANINKDYKNHMSATGSVERGNGIDLDFILPKSNNSEVLVANKSISITWNKLNNVKNYEFKVFDKEETEYKNVSLIDTNVVLDISKITLGSQNEFYIQVCKKGETDAKKIKKRKIIVSKDIELKEKIESIDTLYKDSTSLELYLKAKFYQDNNLTANAIEYYQKAIKLSPDIEEYKDAYYTLLFKNDLQEFIILKK